MSTRPEQTQLNLRASDRLSGGDVRLLNNRLEIHFAENVVQILGKSFHAKRLVVESTNQQELNVRNDEGARLRVDRHEIPAPFRHFTVEKNMNAHILPEQVRAALIEGIAIVKRPGSLTGKDHFYAINRKKFNVLYAASQPHG